MRDSQHELGRYGLHSLADRTRIVIVRLLLHASFPVRVLASAPASSTPFSTIRSPSRVLGRNGVVSRILQIRFRSLISCGQPCPHFASSPVSEADRSIGLSDNKISTNRKWAIYDTSRVHTLLVTPV